MKLNVVLVEPEIPQNTGNVARTCAATGARLHLVGPMGFNIDDKKLKRAGLDYWQYLDVRYYENFQDFVEKNPGARLIMATTNIPMMNADIVTGVSLMLLFVFIGNLFALKESLGFFTVLSAHVTFNLPYVILSVMPRLRATDMSLHEAALDLGCTPTKSFFKVILPSISTSIFTGAIMAFTLSLDDFIISYFTNGPDFQTLPIHIFSMTKKRVKPDMYALSTLIFVAMFILLVLMNVAQSRSDKKQRAKKEES